MAFYHRSGDRKRIAHDFRRQEEEVVGSLCRLGNRPISPKSLLEQEKRIRREIANSNERRRMQSINAGFQSLRTLLPHREGEKLSKAAILQNTADYIYQLEQEKTRLLEQNCQLKRRVINSQSNQDSDGSCSDSPLPKRKKRDAGDSVDEGIGSSSPARSESSLEDVKRELIELRLTLERERSLRAVLEEQIRNLESQLNVAESVHDPAHQNHDLPYHSSSEDTGKMTEMSLMLDSDIRSPESHVSNPEADSSQEVPLRESSPELSIAEVPEDLSGKNNSVLLPCVSELSISDVNTIPGLILSPSPLHDSSPAFSIELEMTSQQLTYKPSTSRQNLETIVEAIRHVEGDHMFRDDPAPTETSTNQWSDQENTDTFDNELSEEQTHQTLHLLTNQDFSFQHQIIRNAPIIQSRPGVIVSNHS